MSIFEMYSNGGAYNNKGYLLRFKRCKNRMFNQGIEKITNEQILFLSRSKKRRIKQERHRYAKTQII